MVMKKCCGVHSLRIVGGITMLALLLAGSANATTFTVNASGGGNYSRIQDAINASSNGDTILVKSGTYFENVKVNKKLTIRGIGNPVVDAGGSGSAITLSANGITLEGFTATGSGYHYYDSPEAGIKVTSSNNTLSDNNASNNGNDINYYGYGITLRSSNNNKLSGNIMNGNRENFNLDGDNDSDFDNHIDTSNLVDGRPIYYIIKVSDKTYDSSSNAGTFYCISCVNVTTKNLNLNKNGKGIYLWNTYQSKIQNVNASNNTIGIYLSSSSNNTLNSDNASNSLTGIYLYESSNNTLSSNNATNNYDDVYRYESSN